MALNIRGLAVVLGVISNIGMQTSNCEHLIHWCISDWHLCTIKFFNHSQAQNII